MLPLHLYLAYDYCIQSSANIVVWVRF